MNFPGQYVPNMLKEINEEITPEIKETEPKQKQYPAVNVIGDESKL